MKYALATALLLAAPTAFASDAVWTASIAVPASDGRSDTVDIVDASEAGCRAQLTRYADAIVIEECQPTGPLAITDPNDENRSVRVAKPRPKK